MTRSVSTPLSLVLLAILICAVPLLSYGLPRVLAYAPGVMALLGVFLLRAAKGEWTGPNILFLWIAGVITALGFLSSIWSLDTGFALERSTKIALVLIPAAFLCGQMQKLKPQDIPFLPAWFSMATLIAGLFVLFDLTTQGAIHIYLRDLPPRFNPSDLNRSVIAFLIFALLSLYLVQTQIECLKTRFTVFASLGLVMGLVLYNTASQTAHIGILMTVVFFVLSPVSMRAFWPVLSLTIFLMLAATPWIAQGLFNALATDVPEGSWLHDAYAMPRMEIWDFVVRRALESPFIGFGIEATRHIQDFDTDLRYTPLNHVLHPHNFAVQLWVEFGALGVIVFGALLVTVLNAIYRLEARSKRFCLAMFMTVLTLAATSYGLWQGWWLGLLAFTACFCAYLSPEKNA